MSSNPSNSGFADKKSYILSLSPSCNGNLNHLAVSWEIQQKDGAFIGKNMEKLAGGWARPSPLKNHGVSEWKSVGMMFHSQYPLVNFTKSYGKSPLLMAKSTISGHFPVRFLYVYQGIGKVRKKSMANQSPPSSFSWWIYASPWLMRPPGFPVGVPGPPRYGRWFITPMKSIVFYSYIMLYHVIPTINHKKSATEIRRFWTLSTGDPIL